MSDKETNVSLDEVLKNAKPSGPVGPSALAYNTASSGDCVEDPENPEAQALAEALAAIKPATLESL